MSAWPFFKQTEVQLCVCVTCVMLTSTVPLVLNSRTVVLDMESRHAREEARTHGRTLACQGMTFAHCTDQYVFMSWLPAITLSYSTQHTSQPPDPKEFIQKATISLKIHMGQHEGEPRREGSGHFKYNNIHVYVLTSSMYKNTKMFNLIKKHNLSMYLFFFFYIR